MKLLILDNYDSFVFNLAQALRSLGAQTRVERNDAVTLHDVIELSPDAIVISPGPGRAEEPAYFGVCAEVLRELDRRIPVLGVCLGHQGIVQCFGGRIVAAPRLMHGKTSAIVHEGTGLFEGIPSPFVAMRYHSLVADPEHMPACLRVTARTTDGVVMAVAHRTAPLFGVQFHPESIGTPDGSRILANFLTLAKRRAVVASTTAR
jgi:anthranilate synthase/aminodeoxychorismate synthase-like glutamine amidotransferase